MSVAVQATGSFNRQNLYDCVKRVPYKEVRPKHAIERSLTPKIPEATLLWGERLLDKGFGQGLDFIKNAVANANQDKKPQIIYATAIKILERHQKFDLLDQVLLHACQQHPHNTRFKATLAKRLIKKNKPDLAIKILKPLHENGHGNTHIANTLGNAYIHAEQPQQAINTLKPLHEGGHGNTHTASILGNAYASTQDLSGFFSIKDDIKPQVHRDFLQAKLNFLNNEQQKVKDILRPYIEKDFDNLGHRINVISLFSACLPNDSQVAKSIFESLNEDVFQRIMMQRIEWMTNPLKVEVLDINFSDAQRLFAEGASAVSAADLKKAGIMGPRPPHPSA